MSTPHAPDLAAFLRGLPKAELHVHIEGTLTPERIFMLAERHGMVLPYADVAALRAAYQFSNLPSFLDLYYTGAGVLHTEQDFHDMTWDYLLRAHADGIVHTEIMFDPQTHTRRGVPMATVFSGIGGALREARSTLGLSCNLILSFLRDLPEADAHATLDDALPLLPHYDDLWVAVGLDSAEAGNPPGRFTNVYARAREAGLRLTAHAGEEGPASYVREALDQLRVQRIDHGVRSEDDPALLQWLADTGIVLTVCPLSNLKLGVVDDLRHHNLKRLLDQDIKVTVNSDDPAYFGGYLVDNYLAVAEALSLSRPDLVRLARHSLEGAFLPYQRKRALLASLEHYANVSRPFQSM